MTGAVIRQCAGVDDVGDEFSALVGAGGESRAKPVADASSMASSSAAESYGQPLVVR